MHQEERDLSIRILEWLVKNGFIIGTFTFSLLAKLHQMMKYRKRLRMIPCIIETGLSGLGSALVLYVMLQMKINTWLFCIIGGFSPLVITPVIDTISKNATPILEQMAADVKARIHKWIKTKE